MFMRHTHICLINLKLFSKLSDARILSLILFQVQIDTIHDQTKHDSLNNNAYSPPHINPFFTANNIINPPIPLTLKIPIKTILKFIELR